MKVAFYRLGVAIDRLSLDIIIVESFHNGDLTQTCGIKLPIRVAVVTLLVTLSLLNPSTMVI